MKACFKCGVVKALDAFYRHPRMADGHLNKCKDCAKQDSHESRHVKHRDRVLAYDRERASQPQRVALRARIQAAYRVEHPDRRRAQAKLRRAVLTGRIQPLPCLECGAKAEAHHPDYSRPLDVVWLCPAHHKQTHAMLEAACESI